MKIHKKRQTFVYGTGFSTTNYSKNAVQKMIPV